MASPAPALPGRPAPQPRRLLSPRRSGPRAPSRPETDARVTGATGLLAQAGCPPIRKGDLRRSPGAYRSEACARGGADGRRAGLRYQGRGAPGSSSREMSLAWAARAPSPAAHPAQQQQANQPGPPPPALGPAPPASPRTWGRGRAVALATRSVCARSRARAPQWRASAARPRRRRRH